MASSQPGMKGADQYRQAALEWLAPKPLVPDFADADIKTMTALGITPPPHFMKARTD